MIDNLSSYFIPEMEIFLDSTNYSRIENGKCDNAELSLLCQDNVNVTLNANSVRIIITRVLKFDPEILFSLSVSFGAVLKFNDKKNEIDWKSLNLAEEFRENGNFVTSQLMSRISLLIGQITSFLGQSPLMLPPELVKK